MFGLLQLHLHLQLLELSYQVPLPLAQLTHGPFYLFTFFGLIYASSYLCLDLETVLFELRKLLHQGILLRNQLFVVGGQIQSILFAERQLRL